MADVGESVQRGLEIVANLPEEAHWLCDKVEPGPNGRQVIVEEDEELRADSTMHAMLLLSFTEQEDNQAWVKGRIAEQLARCSRCVESFYALKRRLHKMLLSEHGEENVNQFFHYLEEWDTERVTPVLSSIVADLDRSLSPDEWYMNLRRDKSRYNTLYECLCSPGLLHSDMINESLRKLCRTGKIEVEGNAPGLIYLLFRDEEEFRTLVKNAWVSKGRTITKAAFERTLLEYLEDATGDAERRYDPATLSLFFRGVAVIAGNVPKDIIMKCISGAQHDPIKLAISRLIPNNSYWPALLGLFAVLMHKLGTDFWDAAAPATSSSLPDIVFSDKVFRNLLQTTEQNIIGEAQLLELTEWTSAYMLTIPHLHKPTSAIPLVRLLLGTDLPALSRGLCVKEAMKVLSTTLGDVHSELKIVEGEANTMIVREANELFDTQMELVAGVAFSHDTFQDKLMEKHMLIAQSAAREAILSILRLELKLVQSEFTLLSRKVPEKPHIPATIRAPLWSTVCAAMSQDDLKFCSRIVGELRVFFTFEKLHIGSNDPLPEDKRKFNQTITEFEKEFAGVLKALSRFPRQSVKDLINSEDTQSAQLVCEVLFGTMLSPSEDIWMAAEDILLQAYDAEEKVDAIRKMFRTDFALPGNSLNELNRALMKNNLFFLMPRWVKFSMSMLDVLCDPLEGLIRSSDLETWQKTLLRIYWDLQWRCLGMIFKRSRRWALSVDKALMMEFLRDAMDYAEKLFDNFWVFDQALHANDSERKEKQREESWGNRLLQDASRTLSPFTVILSIQDSHLLQTCQSLMCKILKQLSQENVQIPEDSYFQSMQKLLYPETFPDYDPSRPKVTNLSDVQKAELSMAIGQLDPDFVPPAKEVIDITEDDYLAGLDDDDFNRIATNVERKTARQTKIEFPSKIAGGSRSTTPKLITAQKSASASALRTISKDSKESTKGFLEKRKAEREAYERKRAAARPKRPDVETSSEDSSSDEEGGSSLFKLGSRTKTLVKDARVIEAPKKTSTRTEATKIAKVKDRRARTAPDLSPLYKQIFKWDFFHEDVFPPGFSSNNYTSVAKSFKVYNDYKRTFEPLLLLEAWQSFLKCKEEILPSSALEVKIATRMRADDFVELETSVMNMGDRNRWYESDVVLLSPSVSPLKASGEPHCIARVHSVNRKFSGAPSCEVQLRCDPGSAMMQNHMRPGGTLRGVKITNLVPLEREYGALDRLQYYDLLDNIMTARPSPAVDPTENQLKRTRDLYDVNEPQARAIISAIKNQGFTLIQGPPGTGKTKTVVAIVGATLTPRAEAIQVPGGIKRPAAASAKKILVCAPSNAAVDELVIRFKQGIKCTNGEMIKPAIVRVGRSDAINAEVKDVTLEELIDARMGLQNSQLQGSAADFEELKKKHSMLVQEKNTKQQQLDDARARKLEPPAGLLVEVEKLNATLREQRRQLDSQRDKKNEGHRNAEILRRRVQQDIMDEAQIICATLSGSGHDMLRNVNVDFETVIIDEAAQSVELSALIPLKFGCERCILVGDPQQLPPTVLSRAAAKFSYEKSLFVRMQENFPKDVLLLSIQYRMHPMISGFPSREFYNSNLQDGEDMARIRKQAWHESTVFGPYRFFNVPGKETTGGRTSLINTQEVSAALDLYTRIATDFSDVNFDGRIGIVTPYRQQLTQLRRRFQDTYGEKILHTIEFNTVDAFQGRERDIIIFSCVRASEEGGIGFLSDVRRMNVGLTRAKSSLFVLGNSKFLVRNSLWRSLIEDAKARNLFTDGDPRHLFQRTTRLNKQITAPPKELPVATETPKQEVAWDPMDIDDESYTNQVQAKPHVPNPSIGVPPSSSRQTQKGVSCYNCGELGHQQKQCPKPTNRKTNKDGSVARSNDRRGHKGPPAYMQNHDPKVPQLQQVVPLPPPPQSLKRSNEEDLAAGPSKRLHSANPTSSGALQGGASNDNNGSKQSAGLPKKGVIKRRDKPSDPFIRQKKPKKPPTAPSNITMSEAKARANSITKSGPS